MALNIDQTLTERFTLYIILSLWFILHSNTRQPSHHVLWCTIYRGEMLVANWILPIPPSCATKQASHFVLSCLMAYCEWFSSLHLNNNNNVMPLRLYCGQCSQESNSFPALYCKIMSHHSSWFVFDYVVLVSGSCSIRGRGHILSVTVC